MRQLPPLFAYLILPLIALTYGFRVSGQNLIQNPSFEQDSSICDMEDIPAYYVYPHWSDCQNFETYSLHLCIEDHFSDHSIPKNHHGYQWPKDGRAYIGINIFEILYDEFDEPNIPNMYRNFLQGTLKQKLTNNRRYALTFYASVMEDYYSAGGVSHPDQTTSPGGVSNLDVWFTDQDFCEDTSRIFDLVDVWERSRKPNAPQIRNPRDRILADTGRWMKVEGAFRADGGESRFLVGVFADSGNIRYKQVFPEEREIEFNAAYYLDDFLLTPLPSLDIPNDTLVLCNQEPRPLFPFPDDSLHQWHNGRQTDTLQARRTGLYWARLSHFDTTVTDSVMIYRLQDLDLGPDTLICQGDSLTLTPNLPPSLTYTWENGANQYARTVSEPGTYWVTAEGDSCTVQDTVVVRDGSLAVNLGPDTTLCAGESYTLSVPDSLKATWSTGVTGPTINLDTAGQYSVTVKNGPCSASDTVAVTYQQPPDATIPADTNFCKGDTFRLPYPEQWSIFKNNTPVSSPVSFTDPGAYALRISNACGTLSQTLKLEERSCPCRVWFPEAFTPGNDNLNETFRPRFDCRLRNFKLTIYNRWGKQVYQTHQIDKGWNPGKDVPAGVYHWQAVYRGLVDGVMRREIESGRVRLIR